MRLALAFLLAAGCAASAGAATLTWTMPVNDANGRPLSTAPLDWQAAYSTQSQTWRNHAYWMKYNADTLAYYWPAVVAEAAPLVVMSGTGVPGWHMSVVAVPVQAWDFPFSYWVRTRQRPNGQWSLWSNPVSRANND